LKRPILRSVLLAPEAIRSISSPDKTVWVNVSIQELEKHPDFGASPPAHCGAGTTYDETKA
jgi:hypothetical protein